MLERSGLDIPDSSEMLRMVEDNSGPGVTKSRQHPVDRVAAPCYNMVSNIYLLL